MAGATSVTSDCPQLQAEEKNCKVGDLQRRFCWYHFNFPEPEVQTDDIASSRDDGLNHSVTTQNTEGSRVRVRDQHYDGDKFNIKLGRAQATVDDQYPQFGRARIFDWLLTSNSLRNTITPPLGSLHRHC